MSAKKQRLKRRLERAIIEREIEARAGAKVAMLFIREKRRADEAERRLSRLLFIDRDNAGAAVRYTIGVSDIELRQLCEDHQQARRQFAEFLADGIVESIVATGRPR